ncbi:MAG TPA: hypothetical protein VFJ88_01085 [Chthoniobacterales bacterium]|nr:hypothetical protein [Chthoniobacterales bacterium]
MEKEPTSQFSRRLPQLYRFCFLMTGETTKALHAFQNTLREAALLASRTQLPADRLWAFHEARHQCLIISNNEVKPESAVLPEEPIGADVAERAKGVDPEQLGAWIAAAAEPQRSALAFYYLNEFTHREMQNLLDLKMSELAGLISHGRAQFQAWLSRVPK